MGGEGPDKLLLTPVRRYVHSENELLATRVEARRLTPVRRPRLELVVRAHGYLRHLLVVPVQVAEDHGERAVGVRFPALEHRRHVLSPVESELRLGPGRGENGHERHSDASGDETCDSHCHEHDSQ